MADRHRRSIGNRRLLRLAAILDTADEEHQKRGEPVYSQRKFTHSCGTPACALAHWAAAHPRRWLFRPALREGLYPLLRLESTGEPLLDAEREFALTGNATVELFSGCGCGFYGRGRDGTAKEAAAYIRAFVARRKKELKR